MQRRGYAILQDPRSLLAQYEAHYFARNNTVVLQQLRETVAFINPAQYRGISRVPLMPYPSLDPAVIRAFEQSGSDMLSNRQARLRFRQLIGDADYAEDYDEDLLPNLASAQNVWRLLDKPEDFEIVLLSREASEIENNLLGFDIGYWGGDHFSLICDAVVMPMWHPPAPQDFVELSSQLGNLNEHVLFDSRSDAERFRAYYLRKSWAETESTPGEFKIIRIGIP